MARFTGSGTFNMSGGKLRDIEFENGDTDTPSLRLTLGPTYISDVLFSNVDIGISGDSGGPAAHTVTIENAFFSSVGTAIEPFGDNWVIEKCDTNIVTTFIDSSDGHDYLRMADCRTAGQINTNGTDHIVFESNVYRGVIDLGTTVEAVYISGVMDTPGGTATALVQGTAVTGFVIDLQAYNGAGYEAAIFTNSSDGEIRGVYGDITAGVTLDGCTDVKVPATLGANGYLGEHGIVFDGCTRCDASRAKVIEPGQDTDNTFDGIHITGGTDNKAIGAEIVPATGANDTRYGINIASGSNAVVHANFLGDSSAYGTADSVDNGTATLTTPDDGVIGGQFAY